MTTVVWHGEKSLRLSASYTPEIVMGSIITWSGVVKSHIMSKKYSFSLQDKM